jgi:hypothetical protein
MASRGGIMVDLEQLGFQGLLCWHEDTAIMSQQAILDDRVVLQHSLRYQS